MEVPQRNFIRIIHNFQKEGSRKMTTNRDIYIVLTGTGTAFSGIIKWFTKAELNHASIAFDSELREVYSFGRKKCTTLLSPD